MQARHLNDRQYFEELARTTGKYILPFIERYRKPEAGMRVLEIGCGVGGNLQPFLERGCEVHGVDITPSKIEAARQIMDPENQPLVTLACEDFFTSPVPREGYDLIFVHDVIEHIYDKAGFLRRIKLFLKPGGAVYFAFPAWQMPFGGHQQICHNWIPSHLPFMHVLPTPLYRSYLRWFESSAENREELLDIKRCKTPIERFKKVVRTEGFRILEEQLYLINPHYETKFGLKPRRLPKWIGGIPYVRNFFATTCFYLIQPAE